MGARMLRLDLFRMDGEMASFAIRLARPSTDPDHIAKLAALRLERGDMRFAPSFGFETVSLAVTKAETLRDMQKPLAALTEQRAEDWTQLVDRLRQKLGDGAVHYLAPFASHLPERAERPSAEASSWDDAPRRTRPLLLLDEPTLVDVLMPVPDGLPQVFHWQGAAHRIAHLEGPERITPEWWRGGKAAARDYYRIEDRNGRRYWLFREKAQWFLHGLFP
jgi:protein ImuB